jgi:hypothetical protein
LEQTPEDIRRKLLELQTMMSRLRVVHAQPTAAVVSFPHHKTAKGALTYVLHISAGSPDLESDAPLKPAARLGPEDYGGGGDYEPQPDGTIRYTFTNLTPGLDYRIQVTALRSTWRTPAVVMSTKGAAKGAYSLPDDHGDHQGRQKVHRSPVKSPEPPSAGLASADKRADKRLSAGRRGGQPGRGERPGASASPSPTPAGRSPGKGN